MQALRQTHDMDSVHFSQRTSTASTAVDVTGPEVNSGLAARRELVGVAAMSWAPVEETLSVKQFRTGHHHQPRTIATFRRGQGDGVASIQRPRTRDVLLAEGLLDPAGQFRGSPAPAADADRGR